MLCYARPRPFLMRALLMVFAVQMLLLGVLGGLGDKSEIALDEPGRHTCSTKTVNRKVRFASLKTTKGNIFVRKYVLQDFLTCLENLEALHVLEATNIYNCANVAEEEGLPAFTFENNICTGLSRLPALGWVQCGADDAASPIYVTKVPQTDNSVPVPEIYDLQLSSTITKVTATWDVTGPQCGVVDQYRFVNGGESQLVQTKSKQLRGLSACTNYTVKVFPVNSQGIDIGLPATKSISTEVEVPQLTVSMVALDGDFGQYGASWTKTNDSCQLVYEYEVVLSDSSGVLNKNFTSDQFMVFYDDLLSCYVNYTVTVSALDITSQVLVSEVSDPTLLTYPPPGPKAEITVTSKSVNMLSFNWIVMDDICDIVRRYNIVIEDKVSHTEVLNIHTNETEYTFTEASQSIYAIFILCQFSDGTYAGWFIPEFVNVI